MSPVPSRQNARRSQIALHRSPIIHDAADHVELRVLEMDVIDPITPIADRLYRVAASDQQVPCVEAYTDVGEGKQLFDLPGRLHVRGGVRVERWLVSPVPTALYHLRHRIGEPGPARVVPPQAVVGLGTARLGQPALRSGIGQRRPRGRSSVSCGVEHVEQPIELQ